jgi:1,3-beta-glucan synthase
LGLIAIIAIQRAIQRILIATCLTREYKHDESNQAWWSGKWTGRGFGYSAFSQPAREFLVKIIEMQLWTGDMILGHVLLLILTPLMLIPFADQLHATSELCLAQMINIVILTLFS